MRMSSDLFLETVTRINIHSSMCLLCMCLCVFKCLRSRLFILVVCLDIGVLSNLDYVDVFDLYFMTDFCVIHISLIVRFSCRIHSLMNPLVRYSLYLVFHLCAEL